MSSSRQIQAIRSIEQKYPADSVHNGRSYKRGYKVLSESVRRLREQRRARREGTEGALGPSWGKERAGE